MGHSHPQTDRPNPFGNPSQPQKPVRKNPGRVEKVVSTPELLAPVKKPVSIRPLPAKPGMRPRASWGIGLVTALALSTGAGLAYKSMSPQSAFAADAPASAPAQVESPKSPEVATPLFGDFKPPAAEATTKVNQQTGPARAPQPFVRSDAKDPFNGTTAIAQAGQPTAQTDASDPFAGNQPGARQTPLGVPTQVKAPSWAANASQGEAARDRARPLTMGEYLGGSQERTSQRQVQAVEQPLSGGGFQQPVRRVQAESTELFFDVPAQPPEMPAPQNPAPEPAQSPDLSFELPAAVPQEVSQPAPAPAVSPGNADWTTPVPAPGPAVQQHDSFEFPEPQRLPEPAIESRTPATFNMDAQPISRAAATAEVDKIHEVQGGDNYWTISRQHYGSARYFAALAEYNRQRIPQPERMKPGMKVLVPSEDLLNKRYPKLTGYVEKEQLPPGVPEQGFFVDSSGQPMYRIGKNDTLTDIAEAHLGRSSRWIQIFGLNRHQLKDPNSLTMGMILQLPRDASQIIVAP